LTYEPGPTDEQLGELEKRMREPRCARCGQTGDEANCDLFEYAIPTTDTVGRLVRRLLARVVGTGYLGNVRDLADHWGGHEDERQLLNQILEERPVPDTFTLLCDKCCHPAMVAADGDYADLGEVDEIHELAGEW